MPENGNEFVGVWSNVTMEDVKNRAVLTVDETAQALGISRNSAYKAVAEGQIPSIRVGKRILVLRKPLNRMLEEPDG